MPTRLTVWPPLNPAAYLQPPRRTLPFPLEDPRCRLVAWARHGIYRGVRQLGLGPGDEILMPAYNHGSEVEALLRAGVGCRYYDVGPSLEPEAAVLEGLLDARVRALYLIHVLGFPQDGARWRSWCDARGLLLIEDAAQAWLATSDSRPVGSSGDLSIFCLYKTFGLPEGAAVLQSSPAPDVGLDRRLGLWPMARRNARWLTARSSLLAGARERASRRRPLEGPGSDLDLRDPRTGPWAHTPFLLRRAVTDDAAARRRENYELLLGELAPMTPRPFADLPAGASPFGFPIETDDVPRVRDRLLQEGVVAIDLWAAGHPAIPRGRFPASERRRARTLILPVHQELRSKDLARIARVTQAAMHH